MQAWVAGYMKRSLRNTTLYLRGIPRDIVRRLKAQAALRGMTLTALVTETLSRMAGEDHLEVLKPLEPDMSWYEAHKRELLQQYRGEHLAIVNRRVLDHDPDFSALATRVFGKIGVRDVFMPLCVEHERTVRLRSPRIVGV